MTIFIIPCPVSPGVCLNVSGRERQRGDQIVRDKKKKERKERTCNDV